MAEQYIFTMLGLNKYYGKKQVLKNINLCFFPGAKIGIVGENGAGKSTVLRIMNGDDDEYSGRADLSKGYYSGMVMQEPILDESLTVRKTLESAFTIIYDMLNKYDQITTAMASEMTDDEMTKAMEKMGDLQDKLDSHDAWNIDTKLKQAADALCLPDDDRIVSSLSGGEKRRVALCKALLEQPDLLLLDEPTNHLDPETIDWLEQQLKEYPGTVLIVTHDRYFLDNVTKWILELDKGMGIPYEGNYSSWIEQKLEKLSAVEKKNSPRAKALNRELSWIKMNNKDRIEIARTRLTEYEQLLARESKVGQTDGNVIEIVPGPELGQDVIKFDNVSKKYNQNTIFENVSFNIPRSAVVGLVGPNGSGKTTLMKLITSHEKPDAGNITVGKTVRLAYVDQERETLSGEVSLIQEIGEGLEDIDFVNYTVPIRKYLARFGFSGTDQQKTIDKLSGGEQSRCHLAKTLKIGGNVLLLDEPTNDLDVNTLRMLEDAILDFSGTVLVISHDRFFLNRICTHLLVFEGEARIKWFEGNYEDYETWRVNELGDKLFENRRNRYRKIVK